MRIIIIITIIIIILGTYNYMHPISGEAEVLTNTQGKTIIIKKTRPTIIIIIIIIMGT